MTKLPRWDDKLWRRRIISYVCFYMRIDKTVEKVIERASKRRPPYGEYLIRAAWPFAEQAYRNAECCQPHNCPDRTTRLCDVPGLILPKGEARGQTTSSSD